jgi:hypothetical protein
MAIIAGKSHMQEELTHWAERLLQGLTGEDIPADIQGDTIRRAIARYRPGRWQRITLHPKLVLETFPLDSWGNVETNQVVSATRGYCNGAAQQVGVLHDGTVVPCCKDFEGQIPLGHATEHSLPAILAAAPACRLRHDFNRLRVNHPVCQQCIGADTPLKAQLRQVGSVLYFKAYSPLMRVIYPGWEKSKFR